MNTPRTLHIISHTHWDREWYMTFQQFRFRLVQLVDRLMDLLDADPDFRYFHLDAQTICIEDYLAVKPRNRDRLLKFVREGRILTGPWYQQNDMFLTSGEATIRNLMVGHRMAVEYGGPGAVMKIGYLPDQFGNISQAPQILRGFGISTAVQGRGYDVHREGSMEYWWEGPDGSRLLTSNLAYWYNNFERIPGELALAITKVDELEAAMGRISRSRHLLFMNGVDHFEAQANLMPMVKAVNGAERGDGRRGTDGPERGTLVQSKLPAYFEALQAEVDAGLELPVHKGELRDGPSLGGLPGTLSSRVYLKQANAKCQTLLERYVEPLSAIAWMMGADYPQDYLTYTWKLLMQSHPHDSICGCSLDQVHREMVPRFEQVEQLADEMIARAWAHIGLALPEPSPLDAPGRQTTFSVFNPLSFARTEIAEVTLDFALGAPDRGRCRVDEDLDVEYIHIYDDAGEPVTHHVVSCGRVQVRVTSPTVLPMAQIVRRFKVQVRAADVPPLGFKTFRAVAMQLPFGSGQAGSDQTTRDAPKLSSLVKFRGLLQNAQIDVSVDASGSFTINTNDSTRPATYNTNVYEDGGDVGDQYTYRAPRRDLVVSSDECAGQIEKVEDSAVAAAFRARIELNVPASASEDRESRSTETAAIKVETTVRLTLEAPYAEVTTVVRNTASDHRVRALFNPGGDPHRVAAQVPFDVVERPRVSSEASSIVATQQPHEQWISVATREPGVEGDNGVDGFTVFTEGIYEHELLRDGYGGDVAITLLRCVDGLMMEPRDPLGHDSTPDAQCLGTHTFHYAVMPHAGTWDKAQIWKYAHAFNAPLRAFQKPEAERETPDYNAVAAHRSDLTPQPRSLEGKGEQALSERAAVAMAQPAPLLSKEGLGVVAGVTNSWAAVALPPPSSPPSGRGGCC